MPLLIGTTAAEHVDLSPPRALGHTAARVVAIDTDVPEATVWRLSAAALTSDAQLREEIEERVVALLGELAAADR